MPSPDQRIQAIARRQHSVFTRAQALEARFTSRMIEGRLALGLWTRVHRGVYALGNAPRTWKSAVMAACLAVDGLAVGRTAAVVWEIPGGRRQPIEIAVKRQSGRRRPGVVVHRWRDCLPGDAVTTDGLPVTSPARTILDLAAVASAATLECALDDVLARELVTLDRLQRRLDREPHQGRKGVVELRSAIAGCNSVVAGTNSHLEPKFFRLFRKLGLPEPTPQAEITLSTGETVRPDFAYLDEGVVIEVNSRRWHAGRAKTEADLRRENQLTLDGHRLVHFTAGDLDRPAYVRDTVLDAIRLANDRGRQG